MPNLDLQLTTSVKVTEYLSFATVSQLTEISIATLETLNPAYRKNFLPENPDGNYLILPRRVAGALIDYLNTPSASRPSLSDRPIVTTSTVNPNSYYEKVKITLGSSDNVSNLAKAFYCSPSNIRAWNSLSSYYVSDGQQIRIFQPKSQLSSEIPSGYVANATPTQEELVAQEENLRKKSITDKYKPDAMMLEIVPPGFEIKIIVAEVEDNNPPSDVVLEKTNIHPLLLDEYAEITTVAAILPLEKIEEVKVENTAIALVLPVENTVANANDLVTKSVEFKPEPVVAFVPLAKVEEIKTETVVLAETKEIVAYAAPEAAKVEEIKIETVVVTEKQEVVADAAPEAAKIEDIKVETVVAAEVKEVIAEVVPVVAKVEEIKVETVVVTEDMKVAATVASDASLIAKMEDQKAEMQTSITAPITEEKPIAKEIFAFTPDVVQDVKAVPTLAISGMSLETAPTLEELKARNQKTNDSDNYVYHFIGRNESLSDIAEKYEGVCVSDILALNQFAQNESLSVGSRIKVKMY